jgi:hypothetical protein
VRLETLNALAQLIAALGVIASLFYLGVQIRQNTRSMRAVVVDSLAQSIADVIRPMAEDRALMRAFHTVVEDWYKATDDDRTRALPLLFSTSSFSKTHGFSNARAHSNLSNGRVGMPTFGCTTIGPG